MKLKNVVPTNELNFNELKRTCNYDNFNFESTDGIEEIDEIIGQGQALSALKLGVEIQSPGYNIFITGLSGTGKFSTVKQTLKNIQPKCKNLKDYAYVFNFENTDQPTLLEFAGGEAKVFKKDMQKAITNLRREIPKALDSEPFLSRRKKLIEELQAAQFELSQTFEKELRKDGFTLGQVKSGETIRPEIMILLKEGPIYLHQIEEMVFEGKITEENFAEITRKYSEHQHGLADLFKKGIILNNDFMENLEKLEKESVEKNINSVFEDLLIHHKSRKVKKYLALIRKNIEERLHNFKAISQKKDEEEISPDELFKVFEVNIILDNSNKNDCPIIVETSPTYSNLFGTIEKVSDGSGFWYSDFTKIKAGSFLRANNGYLIINAEDAFSEFGVWKTLKRALIYGKLEIQDIFQTMNYNPVMLKPEAIDINLKVILIGNSYIYYLLSNYENDFNKIFKVKAEFDHEMNRTEESLLQYAQLIKKIIKAEKLLPFDKSAVGKIIEYGSRYAGNQSKLTTRFAYIADLIRESSFWAVKEKSKIVDETLVSKAFWERRKRHSLYESKVQEMIDKGTILIDVEGERVGQINGLAVYEMNQISFGKPTRITASVAIGNGNFINVEREAGLSGSSHNKAMLIIAGYFREVFGNRHPLSFTASVVFEQGYGMIDGDSASITEIAAIISSITEIPIKQNYAITGSINQKGDIQPIGGVNEKIEGFYDVCKSKGLTGKQGVIIPAQNVQDLMLNDEVVEAVKKGEFHIFKANRAEEALEILMGIQACEKTKEGCFKANTIFGVVEKKLEEIHKKAKNFGLKPKPNTTKTDKTKKTELNK